MFLFCHGLSGGQTPLHTPSTVLHLPANVIGFQQELNTYIWTLQVGKALSLESGLEIRIRERFRSSLLELSDRQKWKDDQNAALSLTYPLLRTIHLHTRFSSFLFKDNQSGFNNDIQTHSGEVGLRFKPDPAVRLQMSLGPKWDQRFQRQDSGLYYRIGGRADQIHWGGYDHTLYLDLGEDHFAVRKNRDVDVGYRVHREFVPGTEDSLLVYTTDRQLDNYASLEGNIERYQDRVMGLDNTLVYAIGSRMQLLLESTIESKTVKVSSLTGTETQQSRERIDTMVDNALTLTYQSGSTFARTRLAYWDQTQEYDVPVEKTGLPFSQRTAFVTPNNNSKRLSLSSWFQTPISPRDSVSAYFSLNRFRYDTPDTNNFDDRDEFRFNSRWIYNHLFSAKLEFTLRLNVNLYHMVYIFGERSADNNWNRILRLSPRIRYRLGDWFKLVQTFEVLANYIDYDFEEKTSATKSFVFRKMAVDDSLIVSLTDRSNLVIDYRLQLEENGQLYWDRWSERVLMTRQSHWLRCLWNYSVSRNFSISPGLTLYKRDEWRHQLDSFGVERRNQVASFTSFGPIFRLRYFPSRQVYISFDGMRQAIDSPNKARYTVNHLNLKLRWTF